MNGCHIAFSLFSRLVMDKNNKIVVKIFFHQNFVSYGTALFH